MTLENWRNYNLYLPNKGYFNRVTSMSYLPKLVMLIEGQLWRQRTAVLSEVYFLGN